MQLYFAYITDYAGTPIMSLQFTATAKHSAFLAQQFIDNCPPAQGFKISKRFFEAKDIARLINKEQGL